MAFPETRARRRTTVLATVLASAALAFMSIGAAAQDNTTTLGSNESDEVPKLAVQNIVDFCQEQAGISVTVNVNDHNTASRTPSGVPAGHAGRRRQVVRWQPRPVLRRPGPADTRQRRLG